MADLVDEWPRRLSHGSHHRAVQTIVAEYNRILASLAETPKDHQPRFTKIDDLAIDATDWDVCFLIGAGFAPKLWLPVIRGRAVTGDIIAPIRKLSETRVRTQ